MLAALWSAVVIIAAFLAAPVMLAGTLFVGAVVSLAAWQDARRAARVEDDPARDDLAGEDLAFAGAKPAQMADFATAPGAGPLLAFRRRRWRRSRQTEWIAFTVAVLMTSTSMSLIAGFIWFVGFRN